MTEHDEAHERLLFAAAVGDADAASEPLAVLRQCAICRERWTELLATRQALAAAAAEQRDILSGGGGDEDDAGDGAMVAGLVRQGLRRRRRSRRFRLILLGVAALLAVAIGLWALDDDGALAPDRLLHVPAPWPVGEDIRDFDDRGFQWPGHPDETYRLLLFPVDNPITAWREIPCTENEWQPEPGDVAEMRERAATWLWLYERTSAPHAQSRAQDVSETFEFSFAR